MAELSADTEAIIARMRAEGDLVRNSGTNSIKSVNVNLDRFRGVFNTISSNIAEQNRAMKVAAGIAEENREYQQQQRDFEDLKREDEVVEKKKDRADGEKRDAALIDAITSQFKMGNLAKMAGLIAAGGSAYFLAKGFFDEKYDGAFTKMESAIGDFAGGGLGDFKTTIDGMKTALDDMKTTMQGLSENLAKLNGVLDTIMSISWTDIANLVLQSIGAMTIIGQSLKLLNKVIPDRVGKVTPGGKKGFFRSLFAAGMTGAAAKELYGNDPDFKAVQSEIDDGAKRGAGYEMQNNAAAARKAAADQAARQAQEVAARKAAIEAFRSADKQSMANYTQYLTRNATNPGMIEVPSLGSGKGSLYNPADNKFYSVDKFDSMGAPRQLTGGAALQAAGNLGQLPFIDKSTPTPTRKPTYSDRLDGKDGQLPDAKKNALMKKMAKENEPLIRKMARSRAIALLGKTIPGLGLAIGAGFAVYSWAIGDYTTAALEGASLPAPSLAGVAFDIGAISTAIFYEVMGRTETYNQLDQGHRAMMVEIARMVKEEVEAWANEQNQKASSGRNKPRGPKQNASREEALPDGRVATYYEQTQSRGAKYAIYDQFGNKMAQRKQLGVGLQNYSDFQINQARNSYVPNMSNAAKAQNGNGNPVILNNTNNISPISQSIVKGGDQVTSILSSGGGGGVVTQFGMGNPHGLNMLLV